MTKLLFALRDMLKQTVGAVFACTAASCAIEKAHGMGQGEIHFIFLKDDRNSPGIKCLLAKWIVMNADVHQTSCLCLLSNILYAHPNISQCAKSNTVQQSGDRFATLDEKCQEDRCARQMPLCTQRDFHQSCLFMILSKHSTVKRKLPSE